MRVTELWKIGTELTYEYEEENFKDDGETISSSLREASADAWVIRSLGGRWSAGLFGEAYTTTFENISLGTGLAPAVELNLFPWIESDRQIVALAYRMGLRTFSYIEETLYDREAESRLYEAVRLRVALLQPWGSLEVGLEGLHYVYDVAKNRVVLDLELEMRITRGLSLVVEAEGRSLRDQIFLPKGDATLEEILLKRRQLATAYEVEAKLGLRFTFGSIYNNVVNPRL